MVRFLDPETAEILQFMDPEIVKMGKIFLDPETVEMVPIVDPKIVEKVNKSFLGKSLVLKYLKCRTFNLLWCLKPMKSLF